MLTLGRHDHQNRGDNPTVLEPQQDLKAVERRQFDVEQDKTWGIIAGRPPTRVAIAQSSVPAIRPTGKHEHREQGTIGAAKTSRLRSSAMTRQHRLARYSAGGAAVASRKSAWLMID
jgi:hypothetical protein